MEHQKQGLSKLIQSNIEDSHATFINLVDKRIFELQGKINEMVDSRIVETSSKVL